MLQLIEQLQLAGYQVTFGSPADWSPHAVELARIDVEAVRIQLNDSRFDDYLQQLQPALVMFDRFMMEEQFGWRVEAVCPQALRILDMEDVHSLRHARQQALKAATELQLQHIHSELALREIAAVLRCDLTLVISEFEMQWLQQQFQIPAAQLCYSPFMLAAAALPASGKTFEQRQHFVCIGNFRHEPNWDAVRWLREAIWPQIRQQLPQAELHIYGAYPPKKATQLHNEKLGFLVKGWADDALQVVADARVMLAPLRFGAGLKGKLIDAALTATPVVTTPIGAEGMYDESTAAAALVAQQPDELAAAAVTLYQQAGPWQQASAAAAQLIERRFNVQQHGDYLRQRLQQLQDNLEQHRLSGFYGAMLRHHSMKSTRYMAQWIEAKNRLAELQQSQLASSGSGAVQGPADQ
ncbi:glycosyltransferase [Oceanobacter mangrovi]|uniref:glycosyltransferase n=1 Tax=Oceanobacter mangrovi TaxID=2862510 RepID=UPI001C8EED50|nr:glycosyltransferase [Oceanobacter mangrovi]